MSARVFRSSPVMSVIEWLASLKLTMLALVLLLGGVIYTYLAEVSATLALVLPLALLALNLLATIVCKPAFRRQTPLLIFHLCLLTIVLLVAVGRLTYLTGQLELAQGEEFNGELSMTHAGPLHPDGLEKLRFINDGFSIAYDIGIQRGKTRNWVHYLDNNHQAQRIEIGDQNPLVLNHYRFYTTPNKGFAPIFMWHPVGGPAVQGAVHLPSYPVNAYSQAREWQLPGTAINVWTMLKFDEVILDPVKSSEFRLPKHHKVVLRIGEMRRELHEGESMELPEGRLVYLGLRSWMGYQVFYDWTIHWLLATCLMAVASLGWYFWKKFSAIPWDQKI